MSDRIAVFHKGRICQTGTPWEVYFRPANRFVADFIGTANLLPGKVEGVDDGAVVVRCADGLFSVRRDEIKVAVGDPVTLMLRPETIAIAGIDAHAEDGKGTLGWEGEIVGSSFLGRMVRYEVLCGSSRIRVDDGNPALKGILQGRVRLFPDPAQIHLLNDESSSEERSYYDKQANK